MKMMIGIFDFCYCLSGLNSHVVCSPDNVNAILLLFRKIGSTKLNNVNAILFCSVLSFHQPSVGADKLSQMHFEF